MFLLKNLVFLLCFACSGQAVSPDFDAGSSDAGSDAEAEADAGPSECWCCVWAPGSAYPNGDVLCSPGVVDETLCYTSSTVCHADDPWGSEN